MSAFIFITASNVTSLERRNDCSYNACSSACIANPRIRVQPLPISHINRLGVYAFLGESSYSDEIITKDAINDELRDITPYLLSEGVKLSVEESKGANIVIKLQGSCDSCSSRAVTLKRAIWKRLRDRWSQVRIYFVEDECEDAQGKCDDSPIDPRDVEIVLESVRGLLKSDGISLTLVDNKSPSNAVEVRVSSRGRPSLFELYRQELTSRLTSAVPGLKQVKFVVEK
eukprot:Rmarinus@m.5904